MKYFIYARKSTEEDDRQVLSIEAQLVELKEFAAKEKLEIVIGAAKPRFAGLAPRRRRRRKQAPLICGSPASGLAAFFIKNCQRTGKYRLELYLRKNKRKFFIKVEIIT